MKIKTKNKTEMLGIRSYPKDKIWFMEKCKELNCTHAELLQAMIELFEDNNA